MDTGLSDAGALVWENICFSYFPNGKHKLFDGFSLSVRKDQITVITGPSGCGKSTLLYLAAGLYPKNAGVLSGGRVWADGLDVAALPPERRAGLIGMVFQNPDLQFCLDTVGNELIFCLENISASPAGMDETMGEALAFCGIQRLRERVLTTLSGGEKQKAMLACVAALRPQWLVLDEPFANIDEGAAGDIAAKLRDLSALSGMGIVAVDHQLGIWREIADELIVLGAGGVVLRRGLNPRRLSPGESEELRRLGVGLPDLPYQAVKPAKAAAGELGAPAEAPEVRGTAAASGAGGTPGAAALPAAGGRPPALRLTNLGVWQEKKEIIRGCSATFAAGRVHAVMGESGAGKSTLFEALCGFRRYTGSVLVGGRELRKIPKGQLGARIGFVFQNPQDQFVTGRVLDEISLGLRAGRRQSREGTGHGRGNAAECLPRGVAPALAGDWTGRGRGGEAECLPRGVAPALAGDGAERGRGDAVVRPREDEAERPREDEAERVLREIGLWPYRLASPYTLSQGQQRRLATAALLVYRCDVLVCDEPTYAQDAAALTAIMGLLQDEVLRRGLTLIFSTHDKKLARDYADQVFILKDGRLRAESEAFLL
ncbi:MAG: energy-coupling factor ABC transporter ATP-binding protein [Peptococcaceae bacterium]|nr:energy-coupling factor ABC transporter ATP-binding protein [Peptococcaceae bacterium]